MINQLQRLPWDSNFFGYEISKIEAKGLEKDSLKHILSQAKKDRFKLIYCFVSPNDAISNTTITNAEGFLVDQKISYVIQLADINYPQSPNIHSYLNKKTNEKLKSLALQSGIASRYKLDSHFKKNEFEKLFIAWLELSMEGKIAKDVFVYVEDEKEIGVITIGVKNERANIGLLAVDEDYRGRAIGKHLINSAFAKARQLSLSEVQVVTQKANIGACAFYEKIGFKAESVENVYHIWV